MNSNIGPVGNFLVAFAKQYGDSEVRPPKQTQRRRTKRFRAGRLG
jgi:hypothetical protein